MHLAVWQRRDELEARRRGQARDPLWVPIVMVVLGFAVIFFAIALVGLVRLVRELLEDTFHPPALPADPAQLSERDAGYAPNSAESLKPRVAPRQEQAGDSILGA